jgi:hypothetical protein
LELRQAVQSLFWQLSEGVAFKAFTEMSNELTLALIRPMPDWSPWIIWKPIWAEMESATQKVKSDLQAGKERMTERMNGFVRSPNLEAMSERELFHAVAAQRSGWICSDLDCLLAGRANNSSVKCPWLIEFLISENLSPAEIQTLKRAVQHHGWAKIPIHAFEILLGTKWEYDSIRGGAAAYEPMTKLTASVPPLPKSCGPFHYRRRYGKSLSKGEGQRVLPNPCAYSSEFPKDS